MLGKNKFIWLHVLSLRPSWAALVCSALLVVSSFSASQQPIDPSAPPSLLEQAERLLNEGKPEEALPLLTTLEENDPKAQRLEADLGKAYFQTKRFGQAAVYLKAALEENANDLQSTQLLAISLYSLGNCHDALPLLEKLGPRIPNSIPDAPFLISICDVMTQQLEQARYSLARTLAVSPDGAMAYLLLGKLLVRQHMVEKAVPQVQTALRLNPRLPLAHFLLGEIELYQTNFPAAVAEFQRELAINPTLWLVYWRLGDAYMRLEKYDDAEKALKEAIWLNDGSADAIVLLGEIALKKSDPALASGFFERALSLDPQNLDAHDSLAKAYKELGHESDADQEAAIAKKLRSARRSSEQVVPQFLP